VAEKEGFEPPVPLSTAVFKTAAIDHSATSPAAKVRFADGSECNGCGILSRRWF